MFYDCPGKKLKQSLLSTDFYGGRWSGDVILNSGQK